MSLLIRTCSTTVLRRIRLGSPQRGPNTERGAQRLVSRPNLALQLRHINLVSRTRRHSSGRLVGARELRYEIEEMLDVVRRASATMPRQVSRERTACGAAYWSLCPCSAYIACQVVAKPS